MMPSGGPLLCIYAWLRSMQAEGKTAVVVAVEGIAQGIVGVADTLRETASRALERLGKTDLNRIVMLTGDNSRTATALANRVGIEDVRAELMPDEKLAAVKQLKEEGEVVQSLLGGSLLLWFI